MIIHSLAVRYRPLTSSDWLRYLMLNTWFAWAETDCSEGVLGLWEMCPFSPQGLPPPLCVAVLLSFRFRLKGRCPDRRPVPHQLPGIAVTVVCILTVLSLTCSRLLDNIARLLLCLSTCAGSVLWEDSDSWPIRGRLVATWTPTSSVRGLGWFESLPLYFGSSVPADLQRSRPKY